MAETVDDDDFERKSTAFIQWLTDNGASMSSKIDLMDLRYRGAGRGVLAMDDLEEDEELFSIPRSLILTAETSSIPAEFKERLTDPWMSLVLAMVYEAQQSSKSAWRSYFGVLPREFDTLIYWTEEELKVLQGSAVVEKIGRAEADRQFTEQIIPIVRGHEEAFNASELDDSAILSLCHQMASTIMAYAFDLEPTSNSSKAEEDGWEEDSDGGEALPKGMIPLADMLNADADRNNSKLFDEDDRVVMRAIKAIQAGEELFNDYGSLPRSDLLRRYGYITENYAKYDVVEVSLDVIKDSAFNEVGKELKLGKKDIQDRLDYLDEVLGSDTAYDLHRASSDEAQFPDELQMLLNGLTMPREEFDKLKSKIKLPKPDLSPDAVLLFFSVLKQRQLMLDRTPEYVIYVKKPAQTLSERRIEMASQVIKGEKEVITEATAALSALLGRDGRKRVVDVIDNEAEEPKKKKSKAGE